MNKNIIVLAGDGIGKEVTQWGVKVLEAIAEKFGHNFTFEEGLIGHSAIEVEGVPISDETIERCRKADAILLGAVGHPMYDNDPSAKVRPEQGLLKIRKDLGLYNNIRPIKVFDELIGASSLKPEVLSGADFLFYRELTSGIYFGTPRERFNNGESARDTKVYHRYEIERIARQAFESARNRRKILHSVDKANVLETSRLWRETVQALSAEYPDVQVTHMFVDNAAMQLIRDPLQFDVILTGNMFGDILSDEASQIVGSLGMLASASVGDTVGMYEPIHGSAPDIAGKNIANPLAIILSTALMLEIAFGLKEEANAVVNSVDQLLKLGYRTGDIADTNTDKDKILGTNQIGEQLIKLITNG
jgi:3-isopropylmalate dehydrogenase